MYGIPVWGKYISVNKWFSLESGFEGIIIAIIAIILYRSITWYDISLICTLQLYMCVFLFRSENAVILTQQSSCDRKA